MPVFIFDNLQEIRRFTLKIALVAIFFILLGIFRSFIPLPPQWFAGLFATPLLVATGLLFLAKPCYVHIEVHQDKLFIAYVNLLFYGLSTSKKGRFVVRKQDFRNYQLHEYNYGLTKELEITTVVQRQLASFPLISLAATSATKRKDLWVALEEFKK